VGFVGELKRFGDLAKKGKIGAACWQPLFQPVEDTKIALR